MDFICKTKCFCGGALYQVGDKLSVETSEISKCDCGTKKKGNNVCGKCHGTGRIYPPYHFDEVTDNDDTIGDIQLSVDTTRVSDSNGN